MIGTTPEKPLVVYLLHFVTPHHEVAHYVGITTPPRLPARMREHASGRGARFTAEACSKQWSWALARRIETDRPELEQELQDHPAIEQECPICRGELLPLMIHPTKNATTREWPRFARRLIEELAFPSSRFSEANEKGGSPEQAPSSLSTGQK